MSDHLHDTEYMARPYCPVCEPDRDPCAEILETRYCGTHQPGLEGSADKDVNTSAYLSGSAEAGGQDNAAWSEMVHRGHVVPVDAQAEILGERNPPDVECFC